VVLVGRDLGRRQVAELYAYDTVTEGSIPVPACDLFLAGFPCASKTSLSSKASGNKHCIRDESGATGVAFATVRKFVAASKPLLVVLENLYNLTQQDDQGTCEAEVIVSAFQDMGYWCVYTALSARDYGSFPERLRTYFVASPEGNASVAKDFFLRVLRALSTQPGDP